MPGSAERRRVPMVDERELRTIVDSIQDFIIVSEANADIAWTSPSWQTFKGLLAFPSDQLDQANYDLAKAMVAEALAAGSASCSMTVLDATGREREVEWRAIAVLDDEGRPYRVQSIGRDVTDERFQTRRADSADKRFREVMLNSPIGMTMSDRDGNYIEVNQSFAQFLGYTRDELKKLDWPSVTHPDDRDHARELHRPLLTGDVTEYRTTKRYLRRNGEIAWADVSVAAVSDEQGALIGVVTQALDITAEHAAREELTFRAAHDVLTGLANRATFTKFLEDHVVAAADASGMAVLFCDLDNFKLVNDGLGHTAGDIFLQEVARRLQHVVRSTDLVARIGGDEFVIALPAMDEPAQAERIASKIIEVMQPGITIEGRTLPAGISIGIAIGKVGSDATSLIQEADTALYRAKKDGRNRWVLFGPELRGSRQNELSMLAQIKAALDNGDFRVWYQPVVRLLDKQVIGYEALARWQHPQLGLIRPDEFIPVAESSGLIVPLGEAIFRQVVHDIEKFDVSTVIGINLSAVQLADPVALRRIEGTLLSHPELAGRLVLEITETAVPRLTPASIASMGRLASHGFNFCLDDFGTGYASFTTLRELPVTTLKIDGSLIKDISTSEKSAALVSSIIAMADVMGMDVVAEHVESDEQERFLITAGARYAQAYRYGRPEPLASTSDGAASGI